MTVLVVDDDQHSRSFLKTALEKAQHVAITADNGADALSILAHTPINLILLDVMMPGMDGHEFCTTVRSDPQFEYIPIIFLSARSSLDDIATAMISGGDDYLIKPVRLRELYAKIDEYAM